MLTTTQNVRWTIMWQCHLQKKLSLDLQSYYAGPRFIQGYLSTPARYNRLDGVVFIHSDESSTVIRMIFFES
jgi:hypothetical protein